MSQLQSGHLGDLGAALVDDQLSPETRDVALAHLASCPDCRRDVEQQRRLKARLSCLTEPSLPLNLATRLNALKADAAPAPSRSEPPAGGLAPALALPARPHSRLLSQRRGRLLAGAASLVLIGIGTAYAAAADVQATAPAGTAANVLTTSGALSPGQTRVVTTSVQLDDPAAAAMNTSFAP